MRKARPPVCFGPSKIEQADDQDRQRGKFLRMRDAEILKSGKRADRGRDQIIGDEQKRADNGDDLASDGARSRKRRRHPGRAGR